jgi:hypothetical protein
VTACVMLDSLRLPSPTQTPGCVCHALPVPTNPPQARHCACSVRQDLTHSPTHRPPVRRVQRERTRPWDCQQRPALCAVLDGIRVLSVRRHPPRASSVVPETTLFHHQQHARCAALEPIQLLLARPRAHSVWLEII